jgi:hypothetical protein
MVHKNLIVWTYICYTSIVHILTSQATIGRSSLGNVHGRNFWEL